MRWTPAFIWITVATVVAAFVSQLLGWQGVRNWILIAWVVLVFLRVWSRGMRGTSLLACLSAVALLGAVLSQLEDWATVRDWFLLAWTVLVLPVAIGLFSHPMRGPAWGLFVGFWGVVGTQWLIVLQILAVVGRLSGHDYDIWAAWPLGLLGLWLFVASSTGFGAERFPRWVDGLGLLAGAGLIAISVSTWTEASADLAREAGLFAAIAYCLWAVGFGLVLWGTQNVTQRFRGQPLRGDSHLKVPGLV